MQLQGLKPGTTIEFDGSSARITETVTLTEDGWSWYEYRLSGHPRAHWLTVDTDDDDAIIVTAWQESPDVLAAVGSDVGDRKIILQGQKYSRRERGHATYRSSDSTSGTVEYVDYSLGGTLIGFERYDGKPWEAARGRFIPNAYIRVTSESA